jgi:hypothetical protein
MPAVMTVAGSTASCKERGTMPVKLVVSANGDDPTLVVRLRIEENLRRRELSPMGEARAITKLYELAGIRRDGGEHRDEVDVRPPTEAERQAWEDGLRAPDGDAAEQRSACLQSLHGRERCLAAA